jgi:O-methyltransferase involved in polyketide biosynthesis
MAASDTKRHDGDSWDLASSVGATATAVAARRTMASKGPDPLLNDPYAELLVNAVGVDAFIRMMNGEVELADNGFDFPEGPTMVAFGDIKYLSAALL